MTGIKRAPVSLWGIAMNDVPANAVSFATDIRRLFTDTDISHMSWFCDLSKYEDVRDNADDILDRLTSSGRRLMPPANSGGPWSADKIALFQKWKDGGCAP
jgi:hypothetical protein